MPRLPTSRANDLVSPSTPAFDAEYAASPVYPREPIIELMLIMRPPPLDVSRYRSTDRDIYSDPRRFTSIIFAASPVGNVARIPSPAIPALFMRPNKPDVPACS